ncbi:MAG: pseudouridine-5'-phosphate glycosidase [Caldisericia bacterium]|nr:pseudouridine-5'-phosphate glycosidase [Caldisericia bacterium]
MKKAKSCKDSIIFSDEFKGSFYPHTCLETTLISFGFPYPDNLKIATKLEEIIRKEEVTPLTIGIRDGKILVGLKEEDFEFFAKSKDVIKANMRDVPYLLSTMKSGALTISGMLYVMDHFSLKFLASGGLGGVHIGFEKYFDISTDLFALSKFKVVLITSGFKSILDIKKSWEFLETLGVPVVGFKTDKLPGFYYRETDIYLDNYFDNIEDLINYIDFWDRFYTSSLLIVNPVPEEDEMDKKEFEDILQSVLKNLEKKKIEGKNITPFILSELHKISNGKTIRANKALLINNAKLCAKVSKLYFEK